MWWREIITRVASLWRKPKPPNLQVFDGILVDRSTTPIKHEKWDPGPVVEDLRLMQALADFESSSPIFPKPLETDESGDEPLEDNDEDTDPGR